MQNPDTARQPTTNKGWGPQGVGPGWVHRAWVRGGSTGRGSGVGPQGVGPGWVSVDIESVGVCHRSLLTVSRQMALVAGRVFRSDAARSLFLVHYAFPGCGPAVLIRPSIKGASLHRRTASLSWENTSRCLRCSGRCNCRGGSWGESRADPGRIQLRY